MSESTITTLVVAFIGAVSAIVVAFIQTRKEKPEQPVGIHLIKPLPPKKQVSFLSLSLFVIAALLLGFISGTLLYSKSSTGATQPIQPRLPTVSASPIISARDIELTAIASETQKAEQRNTLVALVTKEAGATATQNYISLLQTAQANLEATRISEQAQQQVATEQAQRAESTAQAIISAQQTATAIVNNQKVTQLLSFVEQVPNLPVSFYDSFETDKNGWSPKNYDDYSISLKGDVLTTKLKNHSASPLIWTCETCDSFSNFSYQIDIKTPTGAPRIISGIVFGSPTRLDQEPLQEYFLLSIYSSGDLILERVSSSDRDIVEVWEHRQDLLTPDGKFHTLQIVTIDNFATVYFDGKSVGDIFFLEHPTQGYIGIAVESSDVDVVFDNLKVVLMP